MNIEFKSSFKRDLKKIPSEKYDEVLKVIEDVENTKSLLDIGNCKKLAGSSDYYRIKLGSYRISLALQDNTVYFVRILPRKDIYKYFP